jgi:SOS regulatory protein LexA
MNTFGDRLKAAFNTDEIAEIARKMSKSYQAVKNYVEGRIPSAEVLIEISNSTNCSIDWLLTGKGEQKKTLDVLKNSHKNNGEDDLFIPVYLEEHIEEKLRALAKDEKEAPEDIAAKLIIEALINRGIVTDQLEGIELKFFGEYEIKLIDIPLLGTIAAGKPIDVFGVQETVLVAEEFVIPGRETFALRVQGDSMSDQGILDKDLIIVMRCTTANPGQTVVALIDGDKATVKKFYRRGKHIVLRPANPLHQDIVIEAHRVEIQGIVIGLQRRT